MQKFLLDIPSDINSGHWTLLIFIIIIIIIITSELEWDQGRRGGRRGGWRWRCSRHRPQPPPRRWRPTSPPRSCPSWPARQGKISSFIFPLKVLANDKFSSLFFWQKYFSPSPRQYNFLAWRCDLELSLRNVLSLEKFKLSWEVLAEIFTSADNEDLDTIVKI